MAELEEMVAFLYGQVEMAESTYEEEMFREIQDQIYRMIDLEK